MPEDAPQPWRRSTRAIQRMVEFAPATGGLALWMHHHDLADDAVAPVVATDGHTIFYAASFESLPVAEQAGLIAHEVLHVALRHPQRLLELREQLGDVDTRLFNLCADAIVNASLGHLSWLSLPEPALSLEQVLSSALGITENVEKSLLEWDVERLYRAIDDRRAPPQDDARRARSGQRGGASTRAPAASEPSPASVRDQPAPREDGPRSARLRALGAQAIADLQPDPDTRGSPQAQAEQTREWRERILRGHASDGAHSMLRTLIADVAQARTPWEQVLRTRLARSLSPRPQMSWSRPSRSYIANQGRGGPHRRLPWEPGTSQLRAVPRLTVIVDVSGSIDEALMVRFAREIESITRRLEAGLVLVIGDERVLRVEHFEPGRSDLRTIAFHGGGGTDFTPLLEEADRHRPDIAVVLTDLQGPARWQPRWPVIWAVPPESAWATQPFGRKLVLR
ncbi:MAG: hypothetical protein KAY46_27260 [Burkholderiaceae bacterium]|nr:hypothetical protein [Burkholderiaceae bacterium]